MDVYQLFLNIIDGKASTTKDIIKLIYKRVSTFHVMNSIKSFITLQRQSGERLDTTIKQLMENFPEEIPTDKKAREILNEWNEEVRMKMDSYGNKNRIVDSNPGFETIINTEFFSEKPITQVTIKNINDIYYINYINVYIDAMFKMLINKIRGENVKGKS